MAKNKAQKAAEAREAEAERTRVGSDNPAAIQEKMDAVAAQPKPDGKAEKAPATATPATQAVSKQQLTIMRLTVALREQRQIEVKPEMLKQDGKFIMINIGATWPVFRIGANGGIVLPDIRSYKEGMDTWVKADELLARQNARDSKKQAAAAPPATQKAPAEEKQLQTA
jgi:hypothetical protein